MCGQKGWEERWTRIHGPGVEGPEGGREKQWENEWRHFGMNVGGKKGAARVYALP